MRGEKYYQGDTSQARLRLLVKVEIKEGDLEFESCTKDDHKRLDIVKQKLGEIARTKRSRHTQRVDSTIWA